MAEDKSTVLGIRLDAEERKRFDSFVSEEGKNNKTFLDTLLNLYELNKGKIKNINLVGDIETLEEYTNNIHQAFINVIDKLESQKGYIAENSQKGLQIYKDKVNNLQNELEAIKLANSARQTELTSVNDDNSILKERHIQLQESLQDKLTIIKEYQNKNDTLTGLFEEYKQYKVEIEEYKKLLADSQSKIFELKDNLKDKDFTVNGLNKDIENLKEAQEKAIVEFTKIQDQLKNKHNLDIERINDKASIKMDKSLLILQKSQQDQLSHEQLKYNKDIQEYQDKYKALLGELEKARTLPKTKNDTPSRSKKIISK